MTPSSQWVIVGGGFAGAATAWALARAGIGPGIVLEQDPVCGARASGRNAGLIRLTEHDTAVAALARRGLDWIREFHATGAPLYRATGGYTLTGAESAARAEALCEDARRRGLRVTLLEAREARASMPFLDHFSFRAALWCEDEGVADVHALLGRLLSEARQAGVEVRTRTRADALIVEGGRAAGVRTERGDEIRAATVIDASGAWAGALGRGTAPLPLTAFRRHLFVSAPFASVTPDLPFVWMDDAGVYLKPEGNGLLMSPCDETAMPAGEPPVDPAAGELLAEKLARYAPSLAELAIRRSWACLRTFAPDRRPVIGYDPGLAGLFHVSALGGFGVTCSAAIGELAAALIAGCPPGWMAAEDVAPSRIAGRARDVFRA